MESRVVVEWLLLVRQETSTFFMLTIFLSSSCCHNNFWHFMHLTLSIVPQTLSPTYFCIYLQPELWVWVLRKTKPSIVTRWLLELFIVNVIIRLNPVSNKKIFCNIHESFFENVSNTTVIHAYMRITHILLFRWKLNLCKSHWITKTLIAYIPISVLPTHRSSSSALVAAPIKYLNSSIKVNNLRITQSISSLFWWIFCCQSHALP